MRARGVVMAGVGFAVAAALACGKTEEATARPEPVDGGGLADVNDAARADSYPLPDGPPCDGGLRPLDFTPTFKTPAPFDQRKCSDAQVDALLCLFDAQANQQTCTVVVDDPANDECFKCIYTSSSSKELGPIIITGSLGSLNVAGCVGRTTGDVSADGCGASLQAFEQCKDEACDADAPCPEADDAPIDARGACHDKAAKTVCASFAAAAACADSLLAPGGAAHACAQGATFLDRGKALAKLFCSGSADGGIDASNDAPLDAPADGG